MRQQQVYVTLGAERQALVEAVRDRLQAEAPAGVRISLAAAIRHLIDKGLSEPDRQAASAA